ncbi:isochorismatase family cysteine hydrolase [Pedobacter yulinensis]|nr:isochorismatase family cysteine hydrolase [Pedobacter yulinensis]
MDTIMQTLVIIDAQNEFSAGGKRPVPDVLPALEVIKKRIAIARKNGTPIAWVRHFNRPHESPAFMPGTWGSEYLPGLGPDVSNTLEREFKKDVYGAFTGSDIGSWLTDMGSSAVLITGFYTHGCVSTTSREAIMAGLAVSIDPDATATIALEHALLGKISAAQSKVAALLQLENMGARMEAL